MGCDFYILYKLCIEYINNNTTLIHEHLLHDTKSRYYWNECKRDYDFEEVDAFYERCMKERELQIQRKLEKYKPIILYLDNKWLCIKSAQDYYKTILTDLHISEKSIVRIWKEAFYMIK